MTSLKQWNFRALGAVVAVLALGVGLRLAVAAKGAADPAPAEAPLDGAAKPVAAAADSKGEAAGESESVAYPVVLANPVQRVVEDVVRGFGTAHADVRAARSVTSATVVTVTDVLVLPGQRVKRGQALFRAQPDPVAYLAYQQASSAATLARNELDRLTAQRRDGLATATQVDTAQKSLADADAALEAARRQGAAAASMVIPSPIDGIIVTVTVATGDRPAVGAPLATISPPADRVALGIEPGLRSRVHVGDRVKVTPVQGGESPRLGRVSQVGAALDPDSRLLVVIVTLDATDSEPYLTGAAIEGAIQTHAVNAYSVPRAAVVKDDEGAAVFEIVEGKAHRVRVTLVADEGARLGVTGDLNPSRPVATTGAYELEDGVSVEEQKP